jgi:hypothetical protein
MDWEIIVSVGIPAATGVILLTSKLSKIDTRLDFLQKTVESLITRMDRVEQRLDRFELHYKKYRRKKSH